VITTTQNAEATGDMITTQTVQTAGDVITTTHLRLFEHVVLL
jgi:hypothetical protein